MDDFALFMCRRVACGRDGLSRLTERPGRVRHPRLELAEAKAPTAIAPHAMALARRHHEEAWQPTRALPRTGWSLFLPFFAPPAQNGVKDRSDWPAAASRNAHFTQIGALEA